MMCRADWPSTTAACTNSRVRSVRNSPRTSRATGGQETMAMAAMIETMLRREDRDQHDREDEARDGLEELGEAHQQVVDEAAVVAGDGAQDRRR